ncbi:MAG: 30S ribosomal protein S3 [Candidatus Pacearchaeota archaeon]
MEEKNIIKFKKNEFFMKEYIKKFLGKGKVSKIRVEYTPIGEKIIISTSKPGLIIGRQGEKIEELTRLLKEKINLENPHIEIEEIKKPELDAQIMADEIALSLEKFGPLKFKIIAYKALQKIMEAGALGTEIRLSGRLPSERAKSWRFSQGYLKKTGEGAKIVDRAMAIAQTKPGVVGVKVSILLPEAAAKEKIIIDESSIEKIKKNIEMKKNEK